MQTYFTAKRALWILCVLAMPALSGCYTTAGFGRDVQQLGSWIEGGAQDTGAWMYGSEAQAAEAGMTSESVEAMSPAAGGDAAMAPDMDGNAVYFSTGSAEIPPDGLDVIQELASGPGQGDGTIEVIGYTDTAGPAEFNEQLSQRRAEAVADELVAQGVPRESIVVDWRGEDQLPVPTEDDVHEPQNRRVSIAMTGT